MLRVAVCYLPPSHSTCHVDACAFLDTLLVQCDQYMSDCSIYVCGDFNSRIGSREDVIVPGVNTIDPRESVD